MTRKAYGARSIILVVNDQNYTSYLKKYKNQFFLKKYKKLKNLKNYKNKFFKKKI